MIKPKIIRPYDAQKGIYSVTRPISVAAFSGSLRRNSHNSGLLRAAAELMPDLVAVHILEIRDLPFFNTELEGANTPDSVKRFREGIAAADALLIACPEYNYSVTGALKNAVDWASRAPAPGVPPVITGKPAAIMGAGGRFGTVRAQSHLRYILLHGDVKVLNKPELMIPRSGDHFDADGNLTSAEVREQLAALLRSLHAWTLQLQKP